MRFFPPGTTREEIGAELKDAVAAGKVSIEELKLVRVQDYVDQPLFLFKSASPTPATHGIRVRLKDGGKFILHVVSILISNHIKY